MHKAREDFNIDVIQCHHLCLTLEEFAVESSSKEGGVAASDPFVYAEFVASGNVHSCGDFDNVGGQLNGNNDSDDGLRDAFTVSFSITICGLKYN